MPAKWKRKLSDLRSLREQASQSAFDRAKLMTEIFDDAEFRADNPVADDYRLAEILDGFCDDLIVSARGGAMALINLYRHFPDKSRWLKGDFAIMYEEMIAAVKPAAEEGVERRRATLKDLEEAEAQAKRATSRADMLAAELERAQQRIAQLSEDNAVLRGRVQALEEMAKRDPAAA